MRARPSALALSFCQDFQDLLRHLLGINDFPFHINRRCAGPIGSDGNFGLTDIGCQLDRDGLQGDGPKIIDITTMATTARGRWIANLMSVI